jgi:hypothetical protein
MGGLFSRLPSPAAAVAFTALVAALSGSALALPGTGSVDSGDIKNNSIRSKDVHNNSVKGIDVRNNSIRGGDVNESTLGKVPSAGNADNAANATNATNATNAANAANAAAVGGYRIERVAPFTLTNNQTREILKEGPFTFTARCRINFDPDGPGGLDPEDIADILIATSLDNASFDGNDITGDLDSGTPEDQRQFVETVALPVGTPEINQESDATALATDGTEIVGAELYTAVNVLNEPGVCRFGGFFTIG